MFSVVHIKILVYICLPAFIYLDLKKKSWRPIFRCVWSTSRECKSVKPLFPLLCTHELASNLSKKKSEKLSFCCSGWSCFYWRKALVASSGAGLTSSLLQPENVGERSQCPFKKRSNLRLWACAPAFAGLSEHNHIFNHYLLDTSCK